jgi:hypothetical protein
MTQQGVLSHQAFQTANVQAEIRARVRAFETGAVAASVRMLDLSAMPLRRLYAALVARGFAHRRSALVAHRGRRGEAHWRRCDGRTTTDANDLQIVPVDVYVHADGGFVRVFPLGDPLLPVAPDPAAPWAYAGVLLELPVQHEDRFTGQLRMDFDSSPRNEACHVSTSGHPIPRGPRRAHGLRSDPASKLRSLLFARQVMQTARTLLPVHAQEDVAS